MRKIVILFLLLTLVAICDQTRLSSYQTHFTDLQTYSNGPSRIYVNQGTAPVDTVDKGNTYDAVIYLDSADNKIKILKLDGTIVSLE